MQIADSGRIWVTPDSVSMLYEAITSGAVTSILELQPKKKTREVEGVKHLLNMKLISKWPNMTAAGRSADLWEADRAAIWVLERMATTN